MKAQTCAFISEFSTCREDCRYVVFFFAGVLTYQNNFDEAAQEVSRRYPEAKIVIVFPYGSVNSTARSYLSRMLARQLVEVGVDMDHDLSSRVTRCADIVKEHYGGSGELIFIGHSAGGVVAYKTAYHLETTQGLSRIQVFAVGSPKFPLRDVPLNERFTYIVGQKFDPVTCIGTWRRAVSSKYKGRPKRELCMNFNPNNAGIRYHATYFLNSTWTDANQVLHSNARELISVIHSIYPGLDP